jgi:acetyl esterase/lipase
MEEQQHNGTEQEVSEPRRETPGGGARAIQRAQAREQARIAAIRPMAPPRLLLRVYRWFGATFVRELAWQLSVLTGAQLATLMAFGGLRSRAGRIFAAVLGLILGAQLRYAIEAHRSAASVEDALEGLPGDEGRRMPLSHIAVPPLTFVATDVTRERGRVFWREEGAGPDGREEKLRLDVYRAKPGTAGDLPGRRPAVIQVHGGGWVSGSRYEQGVPLLNHLASRGWVGFNIDYRLSPQATWPDHIVDVKRAIAWVREHADELGIDPDLIAITGGSAGGHLTALAGLTANDPAFQPGFEDADTSVIAAVPFYGVYDLTNAGGHYYPQLREWAFEQVMFKRPLAGNEQLYRDASPRWRITADAPPFMVIHGDRDTLVPVGDARDFVAELRQVSHSDVRYVELPNAEHAFDLWPSVRTARVADAIGRFLTSVLEARDEDVVTDTDADTASSPTSTTEEQLTNN